MTAGYLKKAKGEKVKALKADDKWYGVTYKEDKQSVVDAIGALVKDGKYKKMFTLQDSSYNNKKEEAEND